MSFTWTAAPLCVRVAGYLSTHASAGNFAEHVADAVMVAVYSPATFAGGVGAVELPHPPHTINEPMAIAIASRFIVPPNPTDLTLRSVLNRLEGRAGRILRGPYLAPSMMLLMPITKLN